MEMRHMQLLICPVEDLGTVGLRGCSLMGGWTSLRVSESVQTVAVWTQGW